MTLDLQLDDDFNVFDGVQTVTWQPEGAEDVSEIVGLKRRISTREIEASGGLYLPGDVRWHLPPSAESPVVGSILVETDATSWTVLTIEPAVLGSRFTLVARRVTEA